MKPDFMPGQQSMRVVAARAGVSVMTVSRALRNDRRVAETTRQRVLEAAEAVGYRPNPMVSALMANLRRASKRRRETIAFVTSHGRTDNGGDQAAAASREEWEPGRSFTEFRAGAEARAKRLGFDLDQFSLASPGMTDARMSEILRARGISAVVVAPLQVPGGSIRFRWDAFAASAIGYSLAAPLLHRALNHQMHSIRIAINELTARGYRRIGLALDQPNDARADHNWLAGLLLYQSGIGKEHRVPPLLPKVLSPHLLAEWCRKWRPDVVLSVRLAVLTWLKEVGYSVPEEIGFVTLNYFPVLGAVAGIDQNTRDAGAAAVDLAVEQLYANERGIPRKPKSVMVEGEWVEGPTVRGKPKQR